MKLIIPLLIFFTLIVSPIIAIDIDRVQSYSKILKYVDTMKSQVLKDQVSFLKIYDSQRIEHKQEKNQLLQSSQSLNNIKKEVDLSLKRLDALNKDRNSKINEKENIAKSLLAQQKVIKEELFNIERMYKEADNVKHYPDYKDIIKEINDLKSASAKESTDVTDKYKLLLSKIQDNIASKNDEISMTGKTQKSLDALYSTENLKYSNLVKSYTLFMTNYKKIISKNKDISKSFKEELELLNDVYKFITSPNRCSKESKASTMSKGSVSVSKASASVSASKASVSTMPKASASVSASKASVSTMPKASVSASKEVVVPKASVSASKASVSASKEVIVPKASVSASKEVVVPKASVSKEVVVPKASVSKEVVVPKASVSKEVVEPKVSVTVKTTGLTASAIKIAKQRDDDFEKWVSTDVGKDAVKFCRSLGIENKKDIFEGCLTDMLMTNDKNIAREAIVMEDVKNNIKCVGQVCNPVPTTSKVCVGSGDPHYLNYDGEAFHIQEPGAFILTKYSDFEVQEKMRKNGNVNMYGAVSCMTGVAIKYKNVVVEVDPTAYSHIIVNGKKQLLPEDYELVIGGVKIKYGNQLFEWKDKGVTTKALKIKLPNNFEVMVAEGYCGTVSIKAPNTVFGKISGICGNADGIKDANDYKNAAGELVNVNRGKAGWEIGNGGPAFPLEKWQLEWKVLGSKCLFSTDCEKETVVKAVPVAAAAIAVAVVKAVPVAAAAAVVKAVPVAAAAAVVKAVPVAAAAAAVHHVHHIRHAPVPIHHAPAPIHHAPVIVHRAPVPAPAPVHRAPVPAPAPVHRAPVPAPAPVHRAPPAPAPKKNKKL